MNAIIESERDKRVIAWIIAQVGEDETKRAVAVVVAGGRKAYSSNIAKALSLVVPKNLEFASKEVGSAALKAMLAMLKPQYASQP